METDKKLDGFRTPLKKVIRHFEKATQRDLKILTVYQVHDIYT